MPRRALDAQTLGDPGGCLRSFARTLPEAPAEAIARARAQGVPVAALDRLEGALPVGLAGAEPWRAAVRADTERADRLLRATRAVERALVGTAGVARAGSVLGHGWSADVDVYARPDAVEPAGRALRRAGAVPLDRVRAVLSGRGGTRRGVATDFAVLEDGLVVGSAELLTRLWTGGAPAAPAVARATGAGLPSLAAPDVALRRLGKLAAGRATTVRGLAELTALLERDVPLPPALAGGVLRRYAALERTLSGVGPVSAAAATTRRHPAATATWARARARAVRREASRRRRRGQLRVAFCGLDGAGKSTQVAMLVNNLERAGVPARASWTRLGNRASPAVAGLATVAQRLLPSGTHSYEAVRAEAGRREPDRPGAVAPPLTRRGVVGYSWALAVTVDYVLRARAARRRAAGTVLVLDRALPDALVELEDNYGVALDLRLQRRLLERWTPRPDLVFHLQLPGAVAKARKEDVFSAAELEIQRGRYERLLAALDGVVTLDAQRPAAELAAEVLRQVGAGQPPAPAAPGVEGARGRRR